MFTGLACVSPNVRTSKREIAIDKRFFRRYNATIDAMTGRSTACRPCPESPCIGERGRGARPEYIPEQRTEPSLAVGSAGRARYSAGNLFWTPQGRLRELAANQRWYRVFFALCPVGQGVFFMQRQTAEHRGTLCVFLAAVLYSIGGLCIKAIPWNALSINSARNMVALVVVGGYLLLTRHRPRISRGILLGAFSVCGTNVLYALANKLTTAANAIVLQFTAPVFVILLGILFWKKRPGRLDLAACALVLAGVVCFFVDSLEMGGTLGNLLALLSGLSYAGVFLLNDLPGADPISSVFWGDVISAIVGFPFLVQETAFTLTTLFSVVILGAFQVGLAYVLMCIGLRTTPAVTASLISGIEPVLNPILVAVFYGETVGTLAMVGAVIVVGGVLWYNTALARTAETRRDQQQ